MAKRSVTKKGFNRAAVSTTSREFHPCSFKAALPIACDALNARTVAVKACLPSMRVVARKLLTCFPSRCCSLVPQWGSHGAPSVWLGAKRTYPICPILRRRYLASLSLSRNIRTTAVWNETEKGVRRSVTGCSYSALNVRIALISFACSLWRISSSTPK